MEEAVAAGASLEAFLPRDCIARPLQAHQEQAINDAVSLCCRSSDSRSCSVEVG